MTMGIFIIQLFRVLNGRIRILLFWGRPGKKKTVSSEVIRDIYFHFLKDTDDPECIIEHTKEEGLAYAEFHEKFATRPSGSNGARLVVDWDRARFRQSVKVKNLDRNTLFSRVLYNADFALKKMVIGKKHIPAPMNSFAGYSDHHVEERMIANNGFFAYRYETIFYLVPSEIAIIKKPNKIEVKDVEFTLVSKNNYEGKIVGKDAVEEEWAAMFSKNYKSISADVIELGCLNEAYKLFALFKIANRRIPFSDSGQPGIISSCDRVPDSIPAMKYSDIIEIPDPLINEPGRCKYLWFMVSGGIVFKSPGKGVDIISVQSPKNR